MNFVVFIAQDSGGRWLWSFGKLASNRKKVKGRRKPRVDAKALFCYWPARELKILLTDLARDIEMTISGVGYVVQRGETIALRHNFYLLV